MSKVQIEREELDRLHGTIAQLEQKNALLLMGFLTRQIEPYLDAKIVRSKPAPRVMSVKWGEVETIFDRGERGPAAGLGLRVMSCGRIVTFDVECWDEEQVEDQRAILLGIAEFLNRGSKEGT